MASHYSSALVPTLHYGTWQASPKAMATADGPIALTTLILSLAGAGLLLLVVLYFIARGLWLCFWDSYIAPGIREREHLHRSMHLTGRYQSVTASDTSLDLGGQL